MTEQPGINSLPLVDISRFTANEPDRSEFLNAFRRILHDHGFFYLAGHRVAPQLISDVLTGARRRRALKVSAPTRMAAW